MTSTDPRYCGFEYAPGRTCKQARPTAGLRCSAKHPAGPSAGSHVTVPPIVPPPVPSQFIASEDDPERDADGLLLTEMQFKVTERTTDVEVDTFGELFLDEDRMYVLDNMDTFDFDVYEPGKVRLSTVAGGTRRWRTVEANLVGDLEARTVRLVPDVTLRPVPVWAEKYAAADPEAAAWATDLTDEEARRAQRLVEAGVGFGTALHSEYPLYRFGDDRFDDVVSVYSSGAIDPGDAYEILEHCSDPHELRLAVNQCVQGRLTPKSSCGRAKEFLAGLDEKERELFVVLVEGDVTASQTLEEHRAAALRV